MVLSSEENRRGGYQAVATGDKRATKKTFNVTASPFFQPTDPRALRQVSTPGGSLHMDTIKDEAEHKSNILGASSNLVVSIVGAGIVGIPYAIKESGLVAGLFMVVFCAIITEKSLRLLMDTAKHIDVPSYETLFEASFGRIGFIAMCITMFTMSYGAMISYMMIMKDTMCYLMRIDEHNEPLRRAVLTVVTMAALFPLSAQRDMADLAKTSKVSVTFYVLLVMFVLFNSPISETVANNGGWSKTVSSNVIKPATFFTGLGVLSFAYVCQHSAFIIAGSLERPTRTRWAKVTSLSLWFCGVLATLMGASGYLGFLNDTDGNILQNFEAMENHPLLGNLANVARFFLLLCMFFVYPMDAFVTRHVSVVLLFKGRRAHEGDDHAVLKRRDRRVILTFAIYLGTLIPALLLNDLGKVLAVTGAVAGSCLSYIGPGTSYLAVHGEAFIRMMKERWTWRFTSIGGDDDDDDEKATGVEEQRSSSSNAGVNAVKSAVGQVLWYVTLMPLWVSIAKIGQVNLEAHFEKEALKSPHPFRLGKFVHRNPPKARIKAGRRVLIPPKSQQPPLAPSKAAAVDDNDLKSSHSMPRTNSLPGTTAKELDLHVVGYGSISGEKQVAAVTIAQKKPAELENETVEDDPQDEVPTIYDFLIAIGFILFGLVAMIVGLWSIFNVTTGQEVVKSHDPEKELRHHKHSS